ncbi:MAG: DUF2911 domain-containing protein [Saprospiraceae bacterium]|nr:DUF2911 domain-containing protein [Saprospiraceae bacterium]
MRSHRTQRSLATALFLLVAWFLPAQTILTTTPNASQRSTVTQTVGLAEIGITYHRPAVSEREVWGKLVPYDAVWRAGANENTVITFSEKVWVEGKELPAGTYGLHLLPKQNEAVLIFSQNATSWGSFSYDPGEDVLRVTIAPAPSDHFYEYLTYTFDELTADGATCALQWADRKFPFHLRTDTHNAVLASLRNELRSKAGFTWQGWNEAANYCLQNDVNHQEALAWATRSVFMNPNPNNLLTKARLAAKVQGATGAEEQKAVFASLQADLDGQNVTWKEWQAAANYAMQQKDWERSLQWADRSIAMSRNMTNMMTKSQVLAAKGDMKGAEKVKNDAIAKGTNAELNLYGYQLMFSGKTTEALAIFEANAAKYPDDPNVWDSLGEGYVNAGQKDKAIEALKRSLSMNPPANIKANSLRLLEQLGVSHEDLKSKTKP